jgi:hypothetical protein
MAVIPTNSPARRTYRETANGSAQAVVVENQSPPAGLEIGFRTTTLSVGDTAVQLPALAFADRKSVSIQNKGSVILYIGQTNTVTAGATDGSLTDGLEVFPGGFFNIDLANDVDIFGICAAGQSVLVKITEYA